MFDLEGLDKNGGFHEYDENGSLTKFSQICQKFVKSAT